MSGEGHQAGPKVAALYPLARTADVEVNFGVAPVLCDLCALGQRAGIITSDLQRDRVLLGGKSQQIVPISVEDRSGGEHLSVQQCVSAQLPHEVAEVPVAIRHHGRDAEWPAHKGNAGRALQPSQVSTLLSPDFAWDVLL